MITLAADCLLFELPTARASRIRRTWFGWSWRATRQSCSIRSLSEHATKAVFHYFKHELGRQTVSVREFAGALEKVLRGFAVTAQLSPARDPKPRVLEYDLCRLAHESGQGCELVFFPRLRAELQRHLRQSPRVLRFRGLRGCVKQLTGARRWSPRCQTLEGEIVDYLRECLSAEPALAEFAMLVE